MGDFPALFYVGDKFCDFLFGYSANQTPAEKGFGSNFFFF